MSRIYYLGIQTVDTDSKINMGLISQANAEQRNFLFNHKNHYYHGRKLL